MTETPVPAAARVPTELWDIIMRIAQDPPGRRPYFPLLRLKNWKNYSLVCRHWRYVALPYIFRRLRIHAKGPTLEDFPQLLSDAPCEIAEVIQEVVIEYPLNIDITQLDALLDCLPRIQILHLQCNIQRRKRGTERVYRDYTLKQLRWAYQPARMIGLPRAWLFESFLDLLALFTEIEALSFASDGYGEDPGQQLIDGPIPEAPISPDIRQVRSLSFECARFVLSCLPPILSNSYDLRTLKSLTVHMTRPNMLLLLNKLLHLIGPTLRSFELQLNAMDEFISNFRPLLEDIRSGLAACSSLEEFSVSAPLQQDLTRSWRNINHVWHANSWPLVGSATGLVNLSRLSRLRMVIHCTNDRSTAEHVHGLPWSGIRDACKRFPNLRFLHVGVKIEETYYDQRFFNHSLCVKYEMQEFRRILILDEEDTRLPLAQCSNPDCKRFNEVYS